MIFKKQSPRGVLRKSCSENMQQIYRRILMPNCDFIEATLLKSHFGDCKNGCSVNLLHIFGRPFLENTSGRLLLKLLSHLPN